MTERSSDRIHFSIGRSRLRLVLLVALVALVAFPAGVVFATHEFEDVDDDDTHADSIEWLVSAGVTAGCGDGTSYCPRDAVSRAQMATFFFRLAGEDPAIGPSVNAAALLGMSKAELIEAIARASGTLEHTEEWTEAGGYSRGDVVRYANGDEVEKVQPKIYEAVVPSPDPDTSPPDSDDWELLLSADELVTPVERGHEVVTDTMTLAAGADEASVTMTCPDGKLPLSGGYDASSPVLVQTSAPAPDGRGWTITVRRSASTADDDVAIETIEICVG